MCETLLKASLPRQLPSFLYFSAAVLRCTSIKDVRKISKLPEAGELWGQTSTCTVECDVSEHIEKYKFPSALESDEFSVAVQHMMADQGMVAIIFKCVIDPRGVGKGLLKCMFVGTTRNLASSTSGGNKVGSFEWVIPRSPSPHFDCSGVGQSFVCQHVLAWALRCVLNRRWQWGLHPGRYSIDSCLVWCPWLKLGRTIML